MSRYLMSLHFKCLLLATLALPLLATAEKTIYKVVDKDGKVTYTDQKPASNIDYEIRKLPSAKPSDTQNGTPARTWSLDPTPSNKAKKFQGYQSVQITFPANDQTILHDQQEVSVKLVLTPSLYKDHKAQLTFDGRDIDQPSKNLNFVLTDLERGSHQIQVQIVDSNGKTVGSSNTVSIHVKRPIARGALRAP